MCSMYFAVCRLYFNEKFLLFNKIKDTCVSPMWKNGRRGGAVHSSGAYLWSTYYVPGFELGISMQWQDRQGLDPHFGGGGAGGRDRP